MGAILITKRMSKTFNDLVLACTKPVIVHCTCTGNGGTWIEPAAPDYKTQLGYLKDLINTGFPMDRTVLRIDPIIPTPEYLKSAENVLTYVLEQNIPIKRIRFSLLDQYPHVSKRLQALGKPVFYPDKNGKNQFQPPHPMKEAAMAMLMKYPFTFETCAEDWAAKAHPDRFVATGCVGPTDLTAMGLSMPENKFTNPQGRSGCHCLGIKAEMLNRREPCPNKCVYCYWKG